MKKALLFSLLLFLVSATPTHAFRFTATGDYNTTSDTDAVLSKMSQAQANFTLALGDLSQGTLSSESAWCTYVKNYLGTNYPFEIIAGNHDAIYGSDPDRADIYNFTPCLPHRVGSLVGTYGSKYYFDYGTTARFIMISPNLQLTSTTAPTYWEGTTDYQWVSAVIDDARTHNIPWVIVGLHYNCLSVGQYPCQYTSDLVNLFVQKKVDIVMNGHDQTYQRSHQLALSSSCTRINPGTFSGSCVAASGLGGVYTKGVGTLFLTVGTGGDQLYSINLADAELGYFATYMGLNMNPRYGFLQADVDATTFSAKFVGATNTSSYSDIFSIVPATTPPPVNGGFKGEYYPNTTLSGSPAFTHTDAKVDFDWGQNAPDSSLPVDNFSARWTGIQTFGAGTYKFSVRGDDGIRLKIDGTTYINEWQDQGPTQHDAMITLSAGDHTIVLEYYEHTGGAVADMWWTAVSGTPTPTSTPTPTPSPTTAPVTGTLTPTPTPVTPATGFIGEYFSNMTLSGTPKFTRTDTAIDFSWDRPGPNPDAGFPGEQFSVRWTGAPVFVAGSYRFTTTADDGVRVKIDGQTIIDQWKDQGPSTYTADVVLSAGVHTVVMEFYQNWVGSRAYLTWQSTSTPVTPSPTLTPTATKTPTPTPTIVPSTSPSPTPTPIPTQPPVTSANFTAEFYTNKTLSGTPTFTRTDTAINFDWGYDWPDIQLGQNENYSIRWTATPLFLTAGTYRFTMATDDGARLKIDGTTVLDKWYDHGTNPAFTVDIPLSIGPHTIVLEYYQGIVVAKAALGWAPAP